LRFEIRVDLLRLDHVLKHGLDLVDSVMPTLYLELVDHNLFSLVGYTCSIEKPLSEQFSERSYELVPTMEAAEEPHNSVQLLINLVIRELLETLLELIVTVERNIMGCPFTFVHEILEGLISVLLEFHIVAKSLLDKIIHLSFELKKFCGELERVFQVFLILDDLLSLLHDVWVHLVDDVVEC